MRLSITAALLLFSAFAQAAPVTWTINGVQLNGGGTVTGSFDYDATTNAVSSINLVSSAYGDDFVFNDANLFGVFVGLDGGIDTVELSASTESSNTLRNIGFYTDAPLTNAGGVIGIDTVYDLVLVDFFPESEINCLNYSCTGTISAVPVPAAVWLFGSALAGLGWMRRKHSIQH